MTSPEEHPPGAALVPGPPGDFGHEVKFLLPRAAVPAARTLLAGLCRREVPHSMSRVSTIYFDTRTLDSAAEKLASDYFKTKIRLRWYDGTGAVYLEVKRRIGTRREKLRLALSSEAAAFERDGLARAARCDVAAGLHRLGVVAPTGVAPAVWLSYDRERYFDPATGARLSLDTRISPLASAPWCRAEPEEGSGLDLSQIALVELKGMSRELPPALRSLHGLGARRSSFSKFTACLSYLPN